MLPQFGGCQCGEIRYANRLPVLALYVCHCLECQKQSSSGFGMSMPVRREGFQIIKGGPQCWQRKAASGRAIDCFYCRSCGTRIYHAPERNPAVINIKPGTLDDPHSLVPVAHLWVSRAHAWLKPAITGLIYDGQPDGFDTIFDAWARQNPVVAS